MSDTENEITSALVGTKFRPQEAIDAIRQMRPGDAVRLEREPGNQYDALAIRCIYLGLFVGFIPKIVNVRLAPLMDQGGVATAVVETPPVIHGPKFIKVEPKLRITLGEPQQ